MLVIASQKTAGNASSLCPAFQMNWYVLLTFQSLVHLVYKRKSLLTCVFVVGSVISSINCLTKYYIKVEITENTRKNCMISDGGLLKLLYLDVDYEFV